MEVREALEIYKRVWSGLNITDACRKDESVRRSFYRFLEANALEPPRRGEIANKITKQAQRPTRITKKHLTNEKLAEQIRIGIAENAATDASWSRVGVSFLDQDAKVNTSTVTVSEYKQVITELFFGGEQPNKKRTQQ